ncbi:hypothetical protein VNO78_10438 [Psophocarpus tetragonolobus]|uniref:Uncharacterized protein n=1 Tax=Psophocarpus tetragonolobus TaxID=3891 RepID=A0AAN9SKQ8_PSOTE
MGFGIAISKGCIKGLGVARRGHYSGGSQLFLQQDHRWRLVVPGQPSQFASFKEPMDNFDKAKIKISTSLGSESENLSKDYFGSIHERLRDDHGQQKEGSKEDGQPSPYKVVGKRVQNLSPSLNSLHC